MGTSCIVTTDKELISRVLNHPKVYKWISDDCSPEVYDPVMCPGRIYLTDETKSGIVMIDQMNGICCQVHAALLPELWGKGLEFVKATIRWGFAKTRYMKIIAIIPEFNRLTIRIVKECGFAKEGILKKSFLKNWKMHDQVIFGLTKAEFYKEN